MNRNKQVLVDRANVCDSTNKTMKQLYNIALDIGTSSVGWCVTDMNGKLMKFKRRNMWGARLFDKGQTAETRRLKRSLRRRYARRRQRIILLQNLLGDMVNQKDKNFFVRLNESFCGSVIRQKNQIIYCLQIRIIRIKNIIRNIQQSII